MKDVRLLDCTLRDGGYVNDWKFGNGPITSIFDRLDKSGVDIIEVGFLDDRRTFDMDRSIQPDTASFSKVYGSVINRHAMVVAMIDYGTCDISNIQPQSETILDGIRVIFKKNRMYEAVEYGRQIMEKGYHLFLQMVSTTSYEDKDIIEFSKLVNPIKPYAVSIVDTYGLMHKKQAIHYFNMLNKYLDKGIMMGYHSHNNFQMAYSNTVEVLDHDRDRDIIIDGTLYGMGKSAGNAPLELLAMYLNNNYNANYDIGQMMEAISNDIMPIHRRTPWGYGLQYYICAKNNCHPNYSKYLMAKESLSIKSIDEILSYIEPEYQLMYDEDYIEELYADYMSKRFDDSRDLRNLRSNLSGREILLIGPGKSARAQSDRITEYQAENRPVTISVNFIPDYYIDYLFLCNLKRYSYTAPTINTRNIKVISTSNVTSVGRPFRYTIRYDRLITNTADLWNNALIVVLNLFRMIGIGRVTLAGFDGFEKNGSGNYYNDDMIPEGDMEFLLFLNDALKERLKEYSADMEIGFLTDSKYQ